MCTSSKFGPCGNPFNFKTKNFENIKIYWLCQKNVMTCNGALSLLLKIKANLPSSHKGDKYLVDLKELRLGPTFK